MRLEVFLETNLDKLYDILVLHLDGGKDMFITVSADCQRSSFTTSISSLVRIPVPILHLSPEQFKNAVSFVSMQYEKNCNVSFCVFRKTNTHQYYILYLGKYGF